MHPALYQCVSLRVDVDCTPELFLPSFCHTKSRRHDEGYGGGVLTELFHRSSKCSRGLRNHRFASAVDPLDRGKVECPIQICALFKVTGEFGEEEVRCKSQFNELKLGLERVKL